MNFTYRTSILLVPFFSFIINAHVCAEQAAWGGNGGWWGGGNREWIGDFDGPGHTASDCQYYHPQYDYHRHSHPYHYSHPCEHCDSYYYYDSSVPGAGLYLNLECQHPREN